MPKISVTLAAFNVASYVADCLDSILGQEFTDFELIIVDDASHDGTHEILQDYARSDPRIRLFIQDRNQGLAVARNIGIAKAQGEWVTFLDADDLYSPKMLDMALDAAEAQRADMVLWDYTVFTSPTEIQEKIQRPSALAQMDSTDRNALLDRPAFAWTRMVRREALKRLQIEFPHGLTYQDVLVHWNLITQLDHIALVPHRLAHYRQQPQATTAGKGIARADYFLVLDLVETYLNDAGLFDVYGDFFTDRELNAWQGVYDVVTPQHRSAVLAMIRDRFGCRHRQNLASSQCLRWRTRMFFQALDGDVSARLKLTSWSAVRKIYRVVSGKV